MNKQLVSILVCAASLAWAATGLGQESTPTQDTTQAMARSVDPDVYTKLMGQMMSNPMAVMVNPLGTCVQCHTAEDVARFNASMGPMMQMMNPAYWMNPNAYMQMMTAPMDPATYTQWYEAWMKKFGGMMPAPATAPAQ